MNLEPAKRVGLRFSWMAAVLASILLALTYLCFSPPVVAHFLLFFPSKLTDYGQLPSQVFGAQPEEVSFRTPTGNQISGLYFHKPGAKYTVVVHHGQGGNVLTNIGLAKTMLLSGCSALLYDYEGYGLSQGDASLNNILQDGDAATEFLVREKKISDERIIHCGYSLGTGVACHVAERRKCAAVVLIGSYESLTQSALERLPYLKFYPQSWFPKPDIGAIRFVQRNTTIPILLIHGAKDSLIPPRNAKKLYSMSRCPHRCLLVIPSVHHGDFSTLVLASHIHQFISEML